MSLTLVTAPTSEPLTLAELKAQLKVSIPDDDLIVQSFLATARHRAERITGRQFITATWEDGRNAAPCEYEIEVPKPPLASVVSIKYVDPAGVLQTWDSANYVVDAPAGPTAGFGRVRPAYGTNWPATRSDTINAFSIRFTAGYGAAGVAVPADIRAAIMLLIRDLYDADAVSFERATQLLTPYKVWA